MQSPRADIPSAVQMLHQVEQGRRGLEQKYYNPEASVDELFGDSSGMVRQSAIFTVYAKSESRNISFYKKDGRRNVIRHP